MEKSLDLSQRECHAVNIILRMVVTLRSFQKSYRLMGLNGVIGKFELLREICRTIFQNLEPIDIVDPAEINHHVNSLG